MEKIIAREVKPEWIDFESYFDNDGLKSSSGENCACYIIGNERSSGLNGDEYKGIQDQAERIIDGFDDVSNKWTNGYNSYATYKEVMQFNDITYTSRKCYLLKQWVKNADISDTDSIAEFLTITTGEEWNSRSFCGYSQGDYCEVVYCEAHYSEEHITEIGKMWLGCGTEFIIDDCWGYYILDTVRWNEGEELRNKLAEMSGYKPEEIEIYLYDGEHTEVDYKLMEA